ncbi:MAG: hypothetical protein Q8872_01080 [Candidatus Phytoplasma australasiaticum]|nr:hypothetical protein [Candidatus Phytoplasma australasiaticum]
MVILTPPDQGSVASFPTEPTFLPEEQLPLPPQLCEEVKVTTSITETQQPTPEEIFKAKNLLEVQLQQEHMNSLALETQKAQLEYDLIQKQTALENNQKLSEQEKQVFQKEINYQTDQIRAKEKEILVQDQKIKQLTMDLQQEKTLNIEKENQIQQLIDQINVQNQMTEQLQYQLQVQKSLIEAKNQELITNQQLSVQEKQTLQQEIHQLTNAFHQKEQEYQATIQQKDQEIHHLTQIINEQAEEINRLSEELEQQIDKWVQQGLHIQALEETIKALENTSGKYLEENAELRHEINVLKEKLKSEQKNYEEAKNNLKEQEQKLTQKLKECDQIEETIKNQQTWGGSLQPFKTKIIDSVNKKVEKVTSWFRKWF